MIAKREPMAGIAGTISPRRGRVMRLSLPMIAAILVIVSSAGTYRVARADTYNAEVDFTQTTRTLADLPFSSTISTYDANNTDITRSGDQDAVLGNLHAGYYRIPLQWNGGDVVSSAAGGPRNISGDAWIGKIKQFGGTPEIVLGGTSDDNFTPADAASMVQHFNKPANGQADPVGLWVIGNEPDVQGMSIGQYCTLFNQSVAAMKAVDPSIKVAGPAWSHFDPAVLTAFLRCAGSNVDVLDFHNYAMGANSVDTATALSETSSYGAEVSQAYQLIRQYAPNRSIQVQVGEYNWSWTTGDGYPGWQGDDRFYSAINTVWGASVAGQIAAAGARGNEYADLNGALGLTFQQQDAAARYGQHLNSPMPIYYGLEMFTGGDRFRGFGSSMVAAATQLDNVEIYAASNGNIVLINKDPAVTQTATIRLAGFSGGSADIWQTNQDAPFSPPAHVASVSVGSTLSYSLPPYSVTTFVLNSDETLSSQPAPTGEPTAPAGSPTSPAPAPTGPAPTGPAPTGPVPTGPAPTAPASTPVTGPPPGGLQPGPADACAGLSVRPGAAPGQYIFTTHGTSAPGITDVGYAFYFGDGTSESATVNNVRHAYGPGTYNVSAAVDFVGNGTNEQVYSRACTLTLTVARGTAQGR